MLPVLALLAGCREAPEAPPSRWPMGRAEGALQLQVRHPLPNDAMPASRRDYVMGSVGNADATLTIDGAHVPVQRNGSFLAFVHAAAPGSGYVLRATLGTDTARVVVPVNRTGVSAAATAAPSRDIGTAVRGAVAVVPSGNVLDAGLRAVPARSEPDGDYSWLLLAGTRGDVVESRGELRHVAFAGGARAWVDAQFLRASTPLSRMRSVSSSVRLDERADASEIVVATPVPLAYQVVEGEREITLTLYGIERAGVLPVPPSGYVSRLGASSFAGPALRIDAALRGPAFGYEVVWRPGAMVLRLRHPPVVDAVRPMAGLRVVVDAGHPPGGAMGPTGLGESVVTLDVAQRLQRLLVARGARVIMTRADTLPVTLERRVATARAADGHAFVSIHADAIASGNDPSQDNGTAVYANHAHSVPLASAVQLSLVQQLGLPDRGARHGDYAVIRSTWLPAVLCEGATMTIPAQEAALADSSFREAYALGIADGVEVYFRRLRLQAAAGR